MRKRFNSKILNEILKAFSPFYIGWNHHLSSYFLLSSFPNHCYIYNYVSSPSLLHIPSHTSSKILKTIQNYYCHLYFFFFKQWFAWVFVSVIMCSRPWPLTSEDSRPRITYLISNIVLWILVQFYVNAKSVV